ncbi:MAG: hypothetical protein HY606_09740 [Planctomycetes bacterium]|nr:hypothetical protein [Planctomycetota bacterium]
MQQKSDPELINLIKTGKTEALEELFHRYAQSVLNVAYSIVDRQGKAEEVTQTTF